MHVDEYTSRDPDSDYIYVINFENGNIYST